MRDVVICSATRTAIGGFNGTLSPLKASDLGTVVIKAAIEQAGITPTLRPEQLTVADFQHISRFGASLLDNPLKN